MGKLSLAVNELLGFNGSLSAKIFGYKRIPTPEVMGYTDRYGRPSDYRDRETVLSRKNVSPLFGIGAEVPSANSYEVGAIRAALGGNDNLNYGVSNYNYGTLLGISRRNEIIYRCLKLLQDATIAPRLEVQRQVERDVPKIRPVKVLEDREFSQEKIRDWNTETSHPLKKLLMKPNPTMTGKEFLSIWVADLNIFGVFYARKIRSNMLVVKELWRLDPRNVEPYTEKRGQITTWKYTEYDSDGKISNEILIPADEMFFDKLVDPVNPVTGGLSPTAVALNAAMADIGKTDFVRQFFENKATPGGILTIENVVLNQERVEDIKRRWYDRFSARVGGQHSIAVLDQNAKYQQISCKLDELDSEFSTGQIECRLAMIYGVPPVLVFTYGGINRATYTNSDQSEKFFWSNTLMPMFDAKLDALTWNLLVDFETIDDILEERVRLQWNYDEVTALQENKNDKHDRARKNVQAGIWLVSDARAETGVSFDPYSDYYIRQAKLVPAYPDVAAADAAILGQVPSVQVIATPGKYDQQDTDTTKVAQPKADISEIAEAIESANPQADAVRNAIPDAKETKPQ